MRRIFLLGALLVAPIMALAENIQCGAPADWVNLDTFTRVAIASGLSADNETGREAAEVLRAVNWPRLRSWQAEINDPRTNGLIDQVVDNLRIFASTGVLPLPKMMKRDLKQIQKATRKLCYDVDPQTIATDQPRQSPAGFGMSPTGGTFQDYARLTILPAVVAILGLLFKLGQWIKQGIHTRKFSRRSCEIDCMLRVGSASFSGQMTVLGLYGCRFVCTHKDALDDLRTLAENATATVWITELRVPGNVVFLNDSFAALRFHAPLAEQMYWDILERSQTEPAFVRLPPIKHNVAQDSLTAAQDDPDADSKLQVI